MQSFTHYQCFPLKPPPPTPCSTDVAEESGSDVYGAYGVSRQPQSGYDSEPYEGQAIVSQAPNNPRRAPPSTPYLSDYEGPEDDEGSEFIFDDGHILPQSGRHSDDGCDNRIGLLQMQSSAPPPSRVPSPGPPTHLLQHDL